MLAQHDKDRKVLTPDREVAVVTTYSQLLEELWPANDMKAEAASKVIIIAAHGALNFAAALSVSALLRLRNVPHRLLPQDAIQPGKFPDNLAEGASFACLCYLKAPSNAKYTYLEKRIQTRLPQAKIIGLAWADSEGGRSMVNPEHAVTMLPAASKEPNSKSTEHRPTLQNVVTSH